MHNFPFFQGVIIISRVSDESENCYANPIMRLVKNLQREMDSISTCRHLRRTNIEIAFIIEMVGQTAFFQLARKLILFSRRKFVQGVPNYRKAPIISCRSFSYLSAIAKRLKMEKNIQAQSVFVFLPTQVHSERDNSCNQIGLPKKYYALLHNSKPISGL